MEKRFQDRNAAKGQMEVEICDAAKHSMNHCIHLQLLPRGKDDKKNSAITNIKKNE